MKETENKLSVGVRALETTMAEIHPFKQNLEDLEILKVAEDLILSLHSEVSHLTLEVQELKGYRDSLKAIQKENKDLTINQKSMINLSDATSKSLIRTKNEFQETQEAVKEDLDRHTMTLSLLSQMVSELQRQISFTGKKAAKYQNYKTR